MLLKDLALAIDGELFGDPNQEIKGITTTIEARSQDITIITHKKNLEKLDSFQAGCYILGQKVASSKNQIVVRNVRKALARLIQIFSPKPPFIAQISKLAQIAKKTQIGKPVYIGPFCVLEEGCSVGAKTQLKSHVYIGENCQIGQNCFIHSHVTIYDNSVIGDNTIIHAGTVIGADGFGFYPDGQLWQKINHIGKVIIGKDVEIGSNVSIDRGCLGNTIIEDGTKIDNLVHIAHNCTVGKNCAITAQVGLSGGAVLEDHVMIAGQSGLNGYVTIGKNVTVLARSGVTKDIPENTVISGYPAQDHRKELREQALLKALVKKGAKNNENN